MNEIHEIIKAYDDAKAKGQPCVLATVVHLEGSSYRRPGARMLVLEDGLMIGAISGGCLEGDALKKALLTFIEKNNRLITYDTSDEEDASVGVQLGCEGVIQVLFEYIHTHQENNPIELLRKATAQRKTAVLVTLFDLKNKRDVQLGTRLLQIEKDSFASTDLDPALISVLKKDVAVVYEQQVSTFKEYKSGHQINAFIECIEPPISLVVVGAGNDAIPMIQIASILGWEVKVVDGRQTHAKEDRFISACQVLVSKPEAVLEQMVIDNRTCFVLMTHNYNYDVAMLQALLTTEVPYIGVLGPKKKLNKMLDAIKEQGITITDQMLERIYGPTGLDIGAENAGEIATSIIAEIQAVFNNKNGQMLKFKKDVIHS
jgi:xanthine/CO dehydrogenase XdhC/CoxF family maturation factor